MSRRFIQSASVLLFVLALVPVSPGQELVQPATGFVAREAVPFPAGAAPGGVAYAPGGELITHDTGTGEVRLHAAGGPRTLASFDPTVFGSFLVMAPDGAAVYFAESKENGIYSIPLSGAGPIHDDTITYAFDLAFSSVGGLVSAAGLQGKNSVWLLDHDPLAANRELIVGLELYSGPVAVDGAGSLYYVTADPATEFQSLLRFRPEQLQAALAGDPLGSDDAEILLDDLPGIYGARFGGGKLFLSHLGFGSQTGAIFLADPANQFFVTTLATFHHPGEGLLAPSFVEFRPGSRGFEPGAGPGGGSLAVAYSDFASLAGIIEISPETWFVRGGVNNDGLVDISDAVFILAYLFGGGDSPEVRASADVNADGGLDLSDPIYLLDHLFRGGPAPQPPFPAAGPGA